MLERSFKQVIKNNYNHSVSFTKLHTELYANGANEWIFMELHSEPLVFFSFAVNQILIY